MNPQPVPSSAKTDSNITLALEKRQQRPNCKSQLVLLYTTATAAKPPKSGIQPIQDRQAQAEALLYRQSTQNKNSHNTPKIYISKRLTRGTKNMKIVKPYLGSRLNSKRQH